MRKQDARVPLSVVLAVRDEEALVESRLANFLEQDYPGELIEVIVVSDGSTDRTAMLARSFGDRRVRVFELEVPQGKSEAVNFGVRQASHEMIVFADVRQRFSPDSFCGVGVGSGGRERGRRQWGTDHRAGGGERRE